MGEENTGGLTADLQHDVGAAGSTAHYNDALAPEVLGLPVVVAVDDPAGEHVDARDVGDDGDGVVAVTHHHRVVRRNTFFL